MEMERKHENMYGGENIGGYNKQQVGGGKKSLKRSGGGKKAKINKRIREVRSPLKLGKWIQRKKINKR